MEPIADIDLSIASVIEWILKLDKTDLTLAWDAINGGQAGQANTAIIADFEKLMIQFIDLYIQDLTTEDHSRYTVRQRQIVDEITTVLKEKMNQMGDVQDKWSKDFFIDHVQQILQQNADSTSPTI